MNRSALFFAFLWLASHFGFSQDQDKSASIYDYSLKELAELRVITGSLKEENIREAPSNLTIITKQMIEERGYQTLVDLCQDVPGFDFMMYNDGAGEHSTFNMNRGIGSVGNPNILIMIDGIVQNNISFNWSLLWTYENMFIDVERVEIVQGPGSVLYGAQAVTGVIHLITKKDFTGIHAETTFGSNATTMHNLYVGNKFDNGLHASLALHSYHTDGDRGLNRYDPGGYFTNNQFPETLLQDYDREGNYVENVSAPRGGEPIPDGFNTIADSYAMRTRLSYKKTEAGAFISYIDRGGASENVAYEYDLRGAENRARYFMFHTYANNSRDLNSKLNLHSSVVVRGTHVLPETGFQYLYRFEGLTKSYTAYAYQGYIEEKLLYHITSNSLLYFGLKGTLSQKTQRIVSLGEYSRNISFTRSSWDIAENGNGLHQRKDFPIVHARELAGYVLWDQDWNNSLSTSIGVRMDISSEFGHILNPRMSFIYLHPSSAIGTKLMFATAFRQPGIFELTSEFRGNPNLVPERIRTTELEVNSLFLEDKISLKATVFHSNSINFIGKFSDEEKPSGERFENIDDFNIVGITSDFSAQIIPNIRLYANYNFITGVNNGLNSFNDIDRTAKHKVNAGLNVKVFDKKLTSDIRMNWVGERKAQQTNQWLQIYENGYAPGYAKANWVLSYRFQPITCQLIINNLFDTQYYGVGRETGSGFIDEYDYQTNVNPDGHIPAYHPQPGRTFLVKLIYRSK